MILILFPLLYFLAGVDKVVRMILAPPGTLTTVQHAMLHGSFTRQPVIWDQGTLPPIIHFSTSYQGFSRQMFIR